MLSENKRLVVGGEFEAPLSDFSFNLCFFLRDRRLMGWHWTFNP